MGNNDTVRPSFSGDPAGALALARRFGGLDFLPAAMVRPERRGVEDRKNGVFFSEFEPMGSGQSRAERKQLSWRRLDRTHGATSLLRDVRTTWEAGEGSEATDAVPAGVFVVELWPKPAGRFVVVATVQATGTGRERTGGERTGRKRTGRKRTGRKRTGGKRTGRKRTRRERTGRKRTGGERTGRQRRGCRRHPR